MTGKRAQQRVETRERILATARRLFLKSTFEQVGVREIAAEAGVATGTVIAAFGSKGDLLNAIVVEDFHVQLPLMKAAAFAYDTTFDRLTALCNACLAYQANQLAIVRASMADAWTRTDEAENRVRAAVKPLLLFVTQELERGVTRGEIRSNIDQKLIAQMMFETVLHTYRIQIYGDGKPSDLMLILRDRLALLFSAIGVSSEGQPARDVLPRRHDVAA